MLGTLIKLSIGTVVVGVTLHYVGAFDMLKGTVEVSYGTEAVANIGLIKRKLEEWHVLDPSSRPAPRNFTEWKRNGGDYAQEQFEGKFYQTYEFDPKAVFDPLTNHYVGYIKGYGKNDAPDVTIRFKANGESDPPEYQSKLSTSP